MPVKVTRGVGRLVGEGEVRKVRVVVRVSETKRRIVFSVCVSWEGRLPGPIFYISSYFLTVFFLILHMC